MKKDLLFCLAAALVPASALADDARTDTPAKPELVVVTSPATVDCFYGENQFHPLCMETASTSVDAKHLVKAKAETSD